MSLQKLKQIIPYKFVAFMVLTLSVLTLSPNSARAAEPAVLEWPGSAIYLTGTPTARNPPAQMSRDIYLEANVYSWKYLLSSPIGVAVERHIYLEAGVYTWSCVITPYTEYSYRTSCSLTRHDGGGVAILTETTFHVDCPGRWVPWNSTLEGEG